MMLTLYLVFGLLAFELIVLTFLLLPYVNRVTGPMIEQMLIALRKPLRVTLGLLTFFFYEAIMEMMRHQETVENLKPNDLLGRMEALKLKFRSERNFYLFAFTFTVFIIILRLDVILQNYRNSKKRVEELEKQLGGSSTTKTADAKKND